MDATPDHAPVLILGIGNTLMGDEGIGVRVVEALRAELLPDGVELADGGTAGADLLDVLSDRRKVIVVDAIQAAAEPGTVYRLGIEDLVPSGRPGLSLHEIGLLETFHMAKLLGSAPQEVTVFGIVPAKVQPGEQLSDTLAAVVSRVAQAVIAETASVFQ